MKNKDFDYIKQQFDTAQVEIPDELDKRVKSKLNNASPVRIRFRETSAFKAGVSIAACFVVFVMVITTAKFSEIDYRIKPEDTTTVSELKSFDNYDKVKKYIKKAEKENEGTVVEKIKNKVTVKKSDDVILEYGAEGVVSETTATTSSSAETYKQENGVDEADIIKTNGNDIFYLSQKYDEKTDTDIRTVNVFEAQKGKADLVNTINLEDDDSVINDMYVSEDRLVVNCTSFGYNEVYLGASTKSIVYDISNIEEPVEINSFEQSGVYTSSRLIGDTFYIVSDLSINSSDVKNDAYVPTTRCGSMDSEKLEAKDIYYAKNGVGSDYIVVTALDVTTCESIGSTQAVLGCGNDIYCTKDYLYVYGSDMNDPKPNTTIAKISLKNGAKFTDYAKINGYVDSQYSFSKKDNHLCVFTTAVEDDKTVNYLYVLDSNLKQVYKSSPFAKDESIKAVKYIGNFAYVITYEQVDPLFVIDLSNVKKPQFMGSVEVEGFSSMLVNAGKDLVLGVGYNTKNVEEIDMPVVDGIKFVLFDVSNPEEPKVLDEKVYAGLDSEAQYNPKALVQNKEKGYYAIPILDYTNSKKGAIVIAVQEGKLVEKQNYTTSSKDLDNARVTYIDDYYYVIDNSLKVSSFKLK